MAVWSVASNMGDGTCKLFQQEKSAKTGASDATFLGEDNEWLIIFCREMLAEEHFDYFIFGHRHLPLNIELNDNSRYVNLAIG